MTLCKAAVLTSSAATKSPEMGVIAMAVSAVVVPVVSAFTQNEDPERVDEIFSCYDKESSL